MEDLKKLGSFSLGARPEFKNRQQGLAGMKKVYGINNAKFRQLALGVQYQALDTGKVDTANIFTTDAQLASGKYTVLKDPKGVFGFQNVAFVIDKNKLAAARRRTVHERHQRRQQAADDPGDHRDEQGRRDRQAGRGRRWPSSSSRPTT